MGRFRFRMEKVLEFRQHTLEIRRGELAAALARERAALEGLAALRAEINERVASLGARERMGGPAAELAGARRHLQWLDAERAQAEARLAGARAEVERCRRAVLEARQAARVLERLRERRFQEFTEEALRAELAALDDMVQSRYPARREG